MILAERVKVFYDHCKHITVLAAGANAFILTIFEKLSKSPQRPELIGLSISVFCISLIAGLMAMFCFAAFNTERGVDHPDIEGAIKWFACALWSFGTGFTFLVEFVWRNMLPLVFDKVPTGVSIVLVGFSLGLIGLIYRKRRETCHDQEDWRVHTVNRWFENAGPGQRGICVRCKNTVIRQESDGV